MHELSIARSIAAVAARHAGGRRVVAVEVRVGYLRQVVPDSLLFAFSLATAGTALAGAELRLTHVPAAGRCRGCGGQQTLDRFPLRCARCGDRELELLAGDELLVEALELEEEPAPDASAGARRRPRTRSL